jgi:thiol-disulfide isomerase/thioredoxin
MKSMVCKMGVRRRDAMHGVSIWMHGVSIWMHGVSMWMHRVSIWMHGVSIWMHRVSMWMHRVSVIFRDAMHGVSTVITVGIVLILLASCQPPTDHFYLHIALRNAQAGTAYLYRLAPQQAPVRVDSFRHQKLDEDFTLEDLQSGGESIYQLSMPSLRTNLYFISDAPAVYTYINGVNPKTYTTQGSPASRALQTLQQMLNPLQDSLSILSNKINNQIGDETHLRAQALMLRNQINTHYFNFADTTRFTLPAFFIAQQIDFGENPAQHQQFIQGLERRFPKNTVVQDFVQKTKNYLALREVEYEIGQSLPAAQFRDIQGQLQNPSLWRGQYYLLQFWASYCNPCLADLAQKRTVYQKYQPQGFRMLTFSLDEDVEMLQAVLRSQSFPWPVVCDYKGWSSAGVNAYKIDSIPFNILVDPDGKVNMKNVDAIQLDSVLKHQVKVH